MLVGSDERCARCATLLRNGRTICPSCGLDQTSPDAQPAARTGATAAPMAEAKPAAVKKSICPVCMSSVRDDTLVEHERTRICPDCFERIKAKTKPKA